MNLIIGELVKKGMDLIDDVFTSDEEKAQAQRELESLSQAGDLQALNAFVGVLKEKSKVVTAEANSEHWLTANWRPITMMVMLGLIISRWFGIENPDMSPEEYILAWKMLQLGIGGYIGGRTVEKGIKMWKGR